MNQTIQTQLNHRTIREFKDTPIGAEVLDTLYNVANRTASSNGLQSFSIIRVTDKKKRQQIAEVCNQSYVIDVPELLIFVVDCYRNAKIAQEQGIGEDYRVSMDSFFQGFTDGCIAAQNTQIAAESLGIGTVYFGSILNDSAKIIEILGLPSYTFPIVGTGLGYPNQEPKLKPRMDIPLKVFKNTYQSEDNYLEAIRDYDKEFENYYDLRFPDRSLDPFSSQVLRALQNPNPKRVKLLNVVEEQGFNLSLDSIK